MEDAEDKNVTCIDLTGYGTLRSLSFHKIKLKEGLILVFSDFEELSVKGIVFFDKTKLSKNCLGWFAKIKEKDITFKEIAYRFGLDVKCFSCRKNVTKKYFETVGRQYKEVCPFCENSLMLPYSKPENNVLK